MIKVEYLRKVYSTSRNTDSIGLSNVTFTLPDHGFIFITGKSGSGKSTLLNILGGLDTSSGGNIIVDGNDFSTFTEKDFDDYRNTYVGFVFQDFHLIESLTVRQNIKLALDIQGVVSTRKKIKEVLKLVELEGIENRYPRELSGGQKQRIAIARALIKNPKMILADEPTGNLDSKTSRHMLQILQEISKETLVVIVSHNNEDAQFYADRIIELSDGKILRDVTRKSEEETKLISGNVINIPYNRKLNHEERVKVNKALRTGRYTLVQQSDPFTKTRKVEYTDRKYKFKTKSMLPTSVISLSNKFTKGHYMYSFFTAFIMSFIVILFTLCQIFSSFNGKDLVQNGLDFYNCTDYILNKGHMPEGEFVDLNKGEIIKITDEDIQYFYDIGYEGKTYKLYNKYLPCVSKKLQHGSADDLKKEYYYELYSTYYAPEGRGVLDCDVDLLIEKFGVNGEVNVLAGSLDPTFKNDGGIVITDYMADSIRAHNLDLYVLDKEVVYEYLIGLPSMFNRYQIKAIIDTDYETKHESILSDLYDLYSVPSTDEIDTQIEYIKETADYKKLLEDVFNYLSIGYYIDEGTYPDAIMKNVVANGHAIKFKNYVVYDQSNKIISQDELFRIATNNVGYDLKDDETLMPYKTYNLLFGTNIKPGDLSQFENKTITINVYDILDTKKTNPTHQKELKVVGVYFGNSANNFIYVTENTYKYYLDSSVFTSSLYFDDVDSITSVFTPSNRNGVNFYHGDYLLDRTYKILDIFVIFNELFFIVIIGLGLIAVFLMTSYARKSVKRKQLDIGIFRCIGGKNNHLFAIFLYQTVMISLTIMALSTVGLILLDEAINKVLVDSIMAYMKTNLIKDFTIISFDPLLMIIIDVVILFITFLTSSSILSNLKKLKPINIIRNMNTGVFDK